MFANVPHMRVTQERRGMVRMVETDVPTDILDFKVHHLSFFSSADPSGNRASHGPHMALLAILMNPEVRAFREAHNIGPDSEFSSGFSMPGDAMSNKPIVYGNLDDVTVSQALDHVLQTFPGFWVYENCVNKQGERTVRFSFFERPFPLSEYP
jgi:hypothetical protein